MTDRGTPTPKDAASAINGRAYADLRARAAAPDFRGSLFELEAAVEPPPFLGAKVNRLANVTPEGPNPINLMRDVREIVGYLDGVLTPLPLHEPRADQTVKVGNQIALKQEIHDDEFVIEIWPALQLPPANPTYPTEIIDPTKVTRIKYDSYKNPDGVGFIKIDWAEVRGHYQEVEFPKSGLSFRTQPSTFIFRGPNHERARRLEIKEKIGHDIWDPRFRSTE